MAIVPFDQRKPRPDDMTLDEFLRQRVRFLFAEELERSREDVLS